MSLEDTPELKALTTELWSDSPADVGLMTTGIKPVIEDMLKSGVLIEKPDARCNTPIFPVQKAETGKWHMAQDLRAVNAAIQTRAPCVPDPYTLLNELTPDKKWFTVIDLANGLFSIPVHPDSQDWFAFTFQGKKYTYTRLAQGFADSPTIFSQAIQNCMSTLNLPESVQLLTYVDDLLVAADTAENCTKASLMVLRHLAQTGNKVSMSKL